MSKVQTKLPSMIISPFRKGMSYSYNLFASQATTSAGLTLTATPVEAKVSILFSLKSLNQVKVPKHSD